MEKRLGRGLGSLLGEPAAPNAPAELELDRIRPNPFQPRTAMDPAGLEELSTSIRNHGILQPIVVRAASGGGGFELISGERRWRAAKMAGLGQIPAVVRPNVPDAEMLELALVENLQRRDLNPIERARGFESMMTTLRITQEEVAAKVGLKRATVANHVRLLDLPEKIQEALAKGLISMGHARAMLGLLNSDAMLALLDQTVRKDLSVREVEQLVRAAAREVAGAGPPTPRVPPLASAWIDELQRRIQERLGTKVTVQNSDGYEGRIIIEYYSREDLDRLCEVLAPRETL
jgi:ParB family chromosome partitioning protein